MVDAEAYSGRNVNLSVVVFIDCFFYLDWVLSHWVHFTVHGLDLFVFICVYFVLLFFILHICCVIVSTVGWI